MNWNAFASTMLGALISFSAILFTNWLDLRKRKRSHDSLLRALMQGLHDEIGGLMTMSKQSAIELDTLPDGRALELAPSISQDYFIVYHANAALVMQIQDATLRCAIIQTYIQAKGMIDAFRMNQIYLERYHYLQSTFYKTKEASVKAASETYQEALVKMAGQLKKANLAFTTKATHLIAMLAEETGRCQTRAARTGPDHSTLPGKRLSRPSLA